MRDGRGFFFVERVVATRLQAADGKVRFDANPHERNPWGSQIFRSGRTYKYKGLIEKSMIGDNVVLRPPRLSQNTKRLITFAVRVARLMRWVSKTESPHTPLIQGSDPAETVELRSTRADRARSSRNDEAALTKTDTICGREAGTRRSQNRRRDVMRQQHACWRCDSVAMQERTSAKSRSGARVRCVSAGWARGY